MIGLGGGKNDVLGSLKVDAFVCACFEHSSLVSRAETVQDWAMGKAIEVAEDEGGLYQYR